MGPRRTSGLTRTAWSVPLIPEPEHFRHVGNRDVMYGVVAGAVRASIVDPRRGRALAKDLWMLLKRLGAPNVRNVDLSRIRGIADIDIEGPVTRHSSLALSALSVLLECETIFELGTFEGETTWLLAHNRPEARVYTLDLPPGQTAPRAALEITDPEYLNARDRGWRFHSTPEQGRITQLYGDSATFDFSPYTGSMDLVFIDASHSYGYVRSDTEAAFGMLSDLGAIVWDGYTHYPGVYAYLNELAPSLDRAIYHIVGTRLAMYSRWDIVPPDA